MNEVLVNIKGLWVSRELGKDLISVEDLLVEYENALGEIESLKEQLEDLKQEMKDNYKPISHWEEYGLNQNDYH